MCNIISLEQYRNKLRSVTRREITRTLWVCGSCGNRTWHVSSSAELRCAACKVRAYNLKLAAP